LFLFIELHSVVYFPVLFVLFISTLTKRLAGKTTLVISFVSKTRLKSYFVKLSFCIFPTC